MKIEGEINLGDEPYTFTHEGIKFDYRPNLDRAGGVLRKDPDVIGQTTTYYGVLEYTTAGGVRVKGQFTRTPMGVTNWAILAKSGVRISLDGVAWEQDSQGFGGYIVDSDKISEPKVKSVAERLMRAAMAESEARTRSASQAQSDALRKL